MDACAQVLLKPRLSASLQEKKCLSSAAECAPTAHTPSLLTQPTSDIATSIYGHDPRVSTPASFHTYDSLSCFLMTRLPVGSTTHCTPRRTTTSPPPPASPSAKVESVLYPPRS